MNDKPLIAVTMGDPAGIGPEICVKALLDRGTESVRAVLIGDEPPARQAMAQLGISRRLLRVLSEVSGEAVLPGMVNLLPAHAPGIERIRIGRLSAEAGNAAFLYVEKVIGLAMAGIVDATVTAPLNKEALHLAGHPYAGHTEIYAQLTGSPNCSMMLAHGDFRLVHVSTHVSLRKACDLVTRDRVLGVIRLAHGACRQLGIETPRVGVAGLNPHSGEGGLFGMEEIEEIIPAIDAARAEGIEAAGPIPPDVIFSRMRGGAYDICVAMYHDQGHIPVKLLGFDYDPSKGALRRVDGINITLGLPIIRVSVDHGTAFDIAGKGIASPDSLISAIQYAGRMNTDKAV